jgi:hypothetical protein
LFKILGVILSGPAALVELSLIRSFYTPDTVMLMSFISGGYRWYKRSRKSGHSGDNKKFKDLKCTTQKEIRRAYWKYIDGN